MIRDGFAYVAVLLFAALMSLQYDAWLFVSGLLFCFGMLVHDILSYRSGRR